MLAIGIRYLNGFAAAGEPDARDRPEWPPHPGRIYMALAAAHFETGADQAEREALLWLEGTARGGEITAPLITAPDALRRAAASHYVPVNDKAGPSKALLHSLPLTRDRQERTLARAWLDDDTVYFQWPELDPPVAHRDALAGLCAKVARIGHSSSLVQMWLADAGEVTEPTWVPDDARAVVHLRIAGPGTLEYLEHQYNAAAAEDYAQLKVAEMTADDVKVAKDAKRRLREEYGNQPPRRLRPVLSLYQGYARPVQTQAGEAAAGTVFDPHFLALELKPVRGPFRTLDLGATLAVAGRWRDAILSHSNGLSDEVRTVLSGHDPAGGPADVPHLAFLPLAFVGHDQADGHLLGMGIVLPEGLSRRHHREALRAIAAVRELKLGRLGVWHVDPVTAARPVWNLRRETWTAWPAGATHWGTVTPVVFDRHPKARSRARSHGQIADMISSACIHIGLPEPREVIVTRISPHAGVPPSFAFPYLTRKDGGRRRHTHAIVVFDEPVCGPVLIGAGRFRGYGVCRPLNEYGAFE